MQNILPEYKGMMLEVNNRRKTGKLTKLWKLNNSPLNNQQTKEEIISEIIKYRLIKMKIKHI